MEPDYFITRDKGEKVKSDRSFYDGRYNDKWKYRGLKDILRVSETIKYKEIIRFLGNIRAASGNPLEILDFGCGRGRLVSQLKALGNITGVDFSTSAIEQCRVNFPFSKFETVDVTDPTWADERSGSFDAVISVDVIEHLPWSRQDTFLGNMRTLCTPEGSAILTTPIRERILCLKKDGTLSDEEFLKQTEGQPTANQLNFHQLMDMVSRYFEVIEVKEIVPLITARSLDLTVKLASLPFRYRPMQMLTDLIGMKGKYALLLLKPKFRERNGD